jgi:hypothetical protein
MYRLIYSIKYETDYDPCGLVTEYCNIKLQLYKDNKFINLYNTRVDLLDPSEKRTSTQIIQDAFNYILNKNNLTRNDVTFEYKSN